MFMQFCDASYHHITCPFRMKKVTFPKEDNAEKSGLKEKWIQKTSSCSKRKKEINEGKNFV
jgi:hypothetical protein